MRFPHLTRWRGKCLPLVGTAVCGALTVAVYLGGIGPLMGGRERLASHQAKLDLLQERDRQLSAKLTSLEETVSSARQGLAETPLKLQSALHANRRLARLGDIAAASGVKLDETEVGAPLAQLEYQMIPIRLTGRADYQTCAMFLHELGRRFSDMALSSMDLTPQQEDSRGKVTFRMRVIWFTAVDVIGKTGRIPASQPANEESHLGGQT